MSDKITKLQARAKVSFAVFIPGERNPTFVDATDFSIGDGHILYFTKGAGSSNDPYVAVFHAWDYFERIEETAAA